MSSLRKHTRTVGRLLTSAARALVRIPFEAGRFIATQARGTWRNVRGFAGWLSIDRALPPAIASTIMWFGTVIPQALGLGNTNSYEQTAAAAVIMTGAITATVLTFGLTVAVVVAAAPFLLIGLSRFIPAVNSAWKSGRRKIPSRDDVSRPEWDRK